MASKYSGLTKTQKKRHGIEQFGGLDFSDNDGMVQDGFSPYLINLTPTKIGELAKRCGTFLWLTLPEDQPVYGVFFRKDGMVVHCGTKLYKIEHGDNGEKMATALYEQMNTGDSTGLVFSDGKLYILDGKNYLCYDGQTVYQVKEKAKTPLVAIGKKPTGGGTAFEPINLLSKWRIESFEGDGVATQYQLNIQSPEVGTVTAERLTQGGEWQALAVESVNYATGKVTFQSAVEKPPIVNEDNVKIKYALEVPENLKRIETCTIAIAYGVGGSTDRFFLAGGETDSNRDQWSEYQDASYFPDVNYALLGSGNYSITAYGTVGNNLLTIKDGAEDGRNAFLRGGTLNEKGEAVFHILDTVTGEAAAKHGTVEYLSNEALYLSQRGVFAISERMSGQKYSQERSRYVLSAISGAGQKYQTSDNHRRTLKLDMTQGRIAKWKNFVLLYQGKYVFLLDSNQKIYDRNTPESSFQYAAFLWELPKKIDKIFTQGETLYYTSNNDIFSFFTNTEDQKSYEDEGVPIYCAWDTPYFEGGTFYKNKTFTKIIVQLQSAVKTGARILKEVDGIWELIGDTGNKHQYFSWDNIDFSKWTFSTDSTAKNSVSKNKTKKKAKIKFRFENGKLHEPFALAKVAFEYKEQNSDNKG